MSDFLITEEIKETAQEMSNATCALGAIISAATRGDDDPKSYLPGLSFVWAGLHERAERLRSLMDAATENESVR